VQTQHLIYIILDESWGVAGSLSEIFYTLQVRGVINNELGEKMISMVGLRNILIHECNEVDLGIVHEVLRNRLSDIDEFLLSVLNYFRLDEL
jgi:uncharacterized protein YutE (UPF0331/DUF86 family)